LQRQGLFAFYNRKKAKETALSMAEDGMDARLIKVSEDDVRKWIDENFCVVK